MSARTKPPRRAWRWLLATLALVPLLAGAGLAALNRTLVNLALEGQAHYLAMKQPLVHDGLRDGDELACLNAAMLQPMPVAPNELRGNGPVAPETLAEAAEWVDRVLVCTELRELKEDPDHLVSWGQLEPAQERSTLVANVALQLVPRRGATEDNAERCVRLLRFAADLSQLGGAWGLMPDEITREALTTCLPVWAAVPSRRSRAAELDAVAGRFITNRRYIEELDARAVPYALYDWIPPEHRRLSPPRRFARPLTWRWDNALATRRMHGLQLRLAEVADTPGPERQALARDLQRAGDWWLQPTMRGPDLELACYDADLQRAALRWAAAVLRGESPPLPEGATLEGDVVQFHLSARAREPWLVPLPARE